MLTKSDSLNSDLSSCSISEFVRRGDLWSPAKCFDFVGNLVIIPEFCHCRLTTMTGRPQVAPTVLYDKQLHKSEFDGARLCVTDVTQSLGVTGN